MPDSPEVPGHEFPAWLVWGNRCIATDPIGMEYTLGDGDPDRRQALIAAQLQTAANVYRAMAEGAEQLAKIASEGGG